MVVLGGVDGEFAEDLAGGGVRALTVSEDARSGREVSPEAGRVCGGVTSLLWGVGRVGVSVKNAVDPKRYSLLIAVLWLPICILARAAS